MIPGVPGPYFQHYTALKMMGAFIKVEEVTFRKILNDNKALLVVQSKAGIFTQSHLYLTSYKGFVLYTKSKQPISIPEVHEVIQATQVMLPNL
ncbi:MAG: hypothetical protein QY309_09315 [Cyclobacteriaceae bacterium]|nr:MAG: hypothetical protein QY309_09315 [Cyclobacteriaceae bacterium]